MSGKAVDVRIVPQGKDWAVKLTGGLGNGAIKVTSSLDEAMRIARGVAANHEVHLLIYDSQGSLATTEPWQKRYKRRKW